MTQSRKRARNSDILLTAVCLIVGCNRGGTLADQCTSAFPHPSSAQLSADTARVPQAQSLPLYVATESLPQINAPDSAARWYRTVFYANLDAFRGGPAEVRSFLARFRAKIAGRDSAGWFAVIIPDPGPDTARFGLLRNCIGATYGVYVRNAYARGAYLPFSAR
jgi:hypothetical protein